MTNLLNIILKFTSIFASITSYGLIVEYAKYTSSSSFFSLLSFISILIPISDIGYSRFSFNQIMKNIPYSIIIDRTIKRIAFFYILISAPIIYTISLKNVNIILQYISIIISTSPILANILRYKYIKDNKKLNSIIIETIQPFSFLIIITTLISLKIVEKNTDTTEILIYAHISSHLLLLLQFFFSFKNEISQKNLAFKFSKKRILAYIKTIGISIEQCIFAFWIGSPLIILDLLHLYDQTIQASFTQKIIALINAIFSLYSIHKMKSLFLSQQAKFKISFFFISFIILYILLKITDFSIKNYFFNIGLKPNIIRIIETQVSNPLTLIFITLFCLIYLYLQLNLLLKSYLKTRLYGSIIVFISQILIYIILFVFKNTINFNVLFLLPIIAGSIYLFYNSLKNNIILLKI